MKIRSMLLGSILGLTAASANAANILAQTESGSWTVGRSTQISGSTLSETVTASATTNVNVGKYTGTDPLLRVVIRYVQPNPPTSADLTGVLSLPNGGSTNFTSVAVTNSTTITAPSPIASSINVWSGFTYDVNSSSVATVSDSDSLGAFTLMDDETENFSVSYNRDQIIFDSADWSITPAELANIFASNTSTPFSFGIAADVAFSFDRSSTDLIRLTTDGTDSGYIEILYYVPEPSTALLSGLGLLALLRRRR